MGLFSSRQMAGRDADQDPDTNSAAAAATSSVSDANGYRYPPREGRYFGSYFVLGGVRFDSLLPDAFLFGDNSELNFVGSSPVSLPYVLPPRSLPCRTLRALVNIRRDSVRLVRCPPATATASTSAPAAPSPLHSPLSTPPPPATIQAPPAVCFAPQADPCALCCRCATPPSHSHTAADTYNLEFTFDADVACSITVHYVCSELAGKRGPVYRSQLPALASPVYRYPAGAGQRFSQPEHVLLPALLAARCGIGVAAPAAASDDTNLHHHQQQQQLLPVVIECRAEELSSSLADSAAAAGMAASSSASHQCHYTIGFIDAAVASSSSSVPMAGAAPVVADDRSVAVESERSLSAECRCGATVAPSVGQPVNYQLKPIKQKLFVDGLTYLLQEVYGIENKRAPAPPPAHDSTAAVTEIRPPTATTAAAAAAAVRLNSASAGSHEAQSQDVGRRVRGGASASDTSDGALGDSDCEPVPDQNADPVADVEHVDCDNGYEDGDEEDVGDGEDVEEEEEEDTGAECVICMSETRSTLILPCRHLCVCGVCASHLRYQANNCPICRAPFRALLNLQVVLPYADCDDSGDRRRLHHHHQQQQRPQRRRPPRARHQAGVCQEQEAEDEETSHGVSDREQEQADFDEEDPAVSGGSRGLSLVSVLNGPLRNVLDPDYGPDPGQRRSRRSRRRRSRIRTAVRRSRHTPDVNRPFGHGLSFCRGAGSDGNNSSINNNSRSSRSGRGADDTVSAGAVAASLMMDATGGGGGGSSGGGGDDSGSCGAATLLGSTVGLVDCRSLAARDERALRSRTPSREKTQQPPLLPPQQQSSHHHQHHHHHQQQQEDEDDDDDDDVGYELCSR